ncbi:MAG: thiamine phosphate synthase [Spirochaetaceae bacterium]|jgi:thiamine-phosphate pyrophosphorylase|nr:thiamine phosphate synthase [Spirochaetaceae bacterium]
MLKTQDLRLYLCTDRLLSLERPLTEAIEAAVAGGVTLVQLREKKASTGDFYQIALEVHALTRRLHIPLVINDRLDIAQAVDAEGLHLGQADLPLSVARRFFRDRFIGLSASTLEAALRAQAEGADYLGVGPVYPTGSKVDAGDAIGLGCLKAIRAAVRIPVVAIGGINRENAPEVMQTGVAGVAMISGILSQPDIREAARCLWKLVDAEARTGRLG